MKKVIGGELFDTAKAALMACCKVKCQDEWMEVELYRTTNGKFLEKREGYILGENPFKKFCRLGLVVFERDEAFTRWGIEGFGVDIDFHDEFYAEFKEAIAEA
jgi:hypothetical protein